MKKSKINTIPNPNLLKPCFKVTNFDNSLKLIAQDLVETLREHFNDGIGLAANQLGYDKSIFAIEYKGSDGKEIFPLQFFVNPKIIKYSDEIETADEGCLSIPNIFLPVERAKKILFKAQDLDGKTIKIAASDLLARLIQHETDHLNGQIFTNHVKNKLLKEYKNLKKLKIIFIG